MPRATTASAFPPPDADYPVRAAGPWARREWAWLIGLVLLALIPRSIVALQLDSVCDDGYFYLAVTEAYERGDYSAALHYLNINVYPVLLAGLHGLGLQTLAAAKWWGVAAGTLVVLPLFGWLRRMLDRRVAVAACGIYALHTEFIELSPEPIRDPTFWLFCVCGFYFAWRAATERRIWLFAATGLSIALAAHTRTEGWLLALPAIAWPVARWRDAAGRRPAVIFGMTVCLAMTPLFVVAFNLTALADHDRWELGRLEHLRTLGVMPGTVAGRARPPRSIAARKVPPTSTTSEPAATAMIPVRAAADPVASELVEPPARRAGGSRDSHFMLYIESFARTLEPVPLLLMLVGVAVCRRVTVRPEHLVLSACCLAVLFAVWFRLAMTGEINGRYFLLCFFPAAAAAGIGLLATLSFLERRWPEYLKHPRPAAAVVAVAAVVGIAQAGDALLGTHPSRTAECELGQAIARRFGGDRSILVVPRACRVGHAAGGRMPHVMLDVIPIEALLDETCPDLVIIERRDTPRAEFDELYSRITRYGLIPQAPTGLPAEDRFLVLTAPGASASRPLGLAHRGGR